MKRMNVLIDARLMRINKNGPSSYAKNVLLNLSKLDSRNDYTVLVNTEYSNFISSERFHVISKEIKPYRIREHWAIPNLIKDKHFDLFHCMQFVHPIFIKYPTVLTVYDTMHMDKEFFGSSLQRKVLGKYARLLSRYSTKKATSIITISQFSAMQIAKIFNYPIDKIYSIYLGVDESYKNRKREIDFEYCSNKWKISHPF